MVRSTLHFNHTFYERPWCSSTRDTHRHIAHCLRCCSPSKSTKERPEQDHRRKLKRSNPSGSPRTNVHTCIFHTRYNSVPPAGKSPSPIWKPNVGRCTHRVVANSSRRPTVERHQRTCYALRKLGDGQSYYPPLVR